MDNPTAGNVLGDPVTVSPALYIYPYVYMYIYT